MTFQSVKNFFNKPILDLHFAVFLPINISLGLMVAGIYVLFGIDLGALTGWFNLFGPALVANIGIIYCLLLGDDTKSWFRQKLSPYWYKFKRKAGIREVQTDEDTDNYLLRLGLDKPVQSGSVRMPTIEMETVLRSPSPPRSYANTSRTGPPLRNYNSEYNVTTDTVTIPREMAEELGLIQTDMRTERPRPTTVRIERVSSSSYWSTSDEQEE